MTRGHRGSLLLRCRALSSPSPCRFIPAFTTVEDYKRFERVFSTRAAEKWQQHGSNGAQLFRDPNDENRVWALFEWDEEGWQSFVSDPDLPPILQEAGVRSRLQVAAAGGSYEA
jgi:hypothetical protein